VTFWENLSVECSEESSSPRRIVKSNPITGLDRLWGFQEVEAPSFQDSWQIKVVRLSALHTSTFASQEIFLVLISVRGLVNPRTTVRPEGILRPLGIEPATFQFVAQFLNQTVPPCAPKNSEGWKSVLSFPTWTVRPLRWRYHGPLKQWGNTRPVTVSHPTRLVFMFGSLPNWKFSTHVSLSTES
jgi:hypothetical protein